MRFDGIIVAGGAGSRLGGAHKPSLVVGGRTMLDTAVAALRGAGTIVAVGPSMPTLHGVIWAREDPVGGGPVAGLAAGLPHVTADSVVVLAADLPFLTADAIALLAASRGDAMAAVAVDPAGREQPLLACYDTAALREALPAPAAGAAMRTVLTTLRNADGVSQVDLGGTPPVTSDCDTAADLNQMRTLA
jgi:molybdopterin-guanine dinucleotide biosynthesis protein A